MAKKEWYIVQTYSNYENKAKAALEERIASNGAESYFDEIYIPTETVVETRNGKKREVTRKFYNGYVFVKMELNDTTWHIVNSTPKVVGFVGNEKQPTPVAEHEVKQITEGIEDGTLQTSGSLSFSQGDKVRVIEGNFKNFSGTIDEIDEEKERLKVFVEVFGRPTPVEFSFDQVERVEET